MRATTTFVAFLVATSVLAGPVACGRKDSQTPEQQRADIAALEKERAALRVRLDELSVNDPRLEGMPQTSVRIGVPTTLATDIIQRFMSGFVDQVTLELKNIKVKKSGRIKKIVTLGEYDLHLTINRVVGKLKTGKPTVTFGGNKVGIALPVSVVSGTGRATINFKWDGKNITGAVCGDMDITQEVKGGVRPDRYPVAGGLVLTATAKQILASPVFPLIKVNLKVVPSAESWAAAQKILDDKNGVCGFVLDKANVLSHVRRLIDKGFNIKLPTDKIKPLAVPVGINPSMDVRGQTVAFGIKVSDLAITKHMIWLGSQVTVAVGDEAAATMNTADEPAAPKGARPSTEKAPKPKTVKAPGSVDSTVTKPAIPGTAAPVENTLTEI